MYQCGGKNVVDKQYCGIVGTFSKGELRVLGNSKDFERIEIVERNLDILSEELKQAI